MPGQSARLHAVAVLSQSTLSGGFGFAFAITWAWSSLFHWYTHYMVASP